MKNLSLYDRLDHYVPTSGRIIEPSLAGRLGQAKSGIAVTLSLSVSYSTAMADEMFMFGVVTGVFAVLTGLLFASRAKRKSVDLEVESRAGAPI
jgi:hypothetical protein